MIIPSATSVRCFTVLVCACFAITMNADAASEKLLFDFQTATNSTAWQVVNDDVPPLNPAKVAVVGFLISDQQEGAFKLEVAWIKASAPAGK